MSAPRGDVRIELQYRWGFEDGPQRPLSHPVVSMLRAVRDGGSVQAASLALDVSYRHAWGLLRRAEQDLGCNLVRWVRGQRCVLTERGEALVHAEDLALSRLAPQIDALRAELSQAFHAALGPGSLPLPLPLTLFASHDMALPALRGLARGRGLRLDLRFTGSVDALRALAARRCLIAGFHAPLAAPAGSDYARQLKPLLQPGVHKLIGFALRSQGLILPRGNPLGLESHLAVAAAVACGAADVGIGIEAAARAFSLDFVPLARERYAFVCLKPDLDDPAVQALRALLAEPQWMRQLAEIPGYEADSAGAVLRLTEALPWWSDLSAAAPLAAERP